MRIAEVCLSPSLGGLELYYLRVVRHLALSGALAGAVAAPGTPIAALLAEEGIVFHPIPARFHRVSLLAGWRLARWLDAHAIDVLHVHYGADLNLSAFARRLARRPVRIVYTRHMQIFDPKRDPFHRWVYAQVDRLIVISRLMEAAAHRHLPIPASRVRLLYHGVAKPTSPPPLLCAELRARLGIPPAAFAVVLVGRIEQGKGQGVLVEAMRILAARGVDAHAVLVGAATTVSYLTALEATITRAGLQDRVHVDGFHPRPQEIMPCFDCLVLVTDIEAFGLVLVEAMRAGIAVVGTDTGGVPEIIEDGVTGLLVPPRDPAALADALERLAADPALRAQLARAGEASADERFDEEWHFAGLAKILEELDGPTRPATRG